MPRRRKIGDLFEMQTRHGLGYLQYCHWHDFYLELSRVIAGLHPKRPDDLESLVRGPMLCWASTHLGSLLHYKEVTYLGNFPVPEEARAWPELRGPALFGNEHGIRKWIVLTRGADGELVSWRFSEGGLSEEDSKLSIGMLRSAESFRNIVENQRRPEEEFLPD